MQTTAISGSKPLPQDGGRYLTDEKFLPGEEVTLNRFIAYHTASAKRGQPTLSPSEMLAELNKGEPHSDLFLKKITALATKQSSDLVSESDEDYENGRIMRATAGLGIAREYRELGSFIDAKYPADKARTGLPKNLSNCLNPNDPKTVAQELLSGPLQALEKILARKSGDWGGGAYIRSRSEELEPLRQELAILTRALTLITEGKATGVPLSVVERIPNFRSGISSVCGRWTADAAAPRYNGAAHVVAEQRYRETEACGVGMAYPHLEALDSITSQLLAF